MFSNVLFYVIQILDQRSLFFLNTLGSWIMDHRTWIMDHGWIMDYGSWIMALASAIVKKEHFLQPRNGADHIERSETGSSLT